jgi:hypothetical protein
MRSSILLPLFLSSIVGAAPTPQVTTGAPPTTPATSPPVAPAALAGGFDLGALASGLGGLDLGALLGGLDLGALLGGLGAPDAAADVIIAGYKAVTEKNNAVVKAAEAIPATGDATAAIKDLLAKINDATAALKDATTKAGAAQVVGFGGALGLGTPGSEVTASVTKAADAVVAKKDAVIKAGQKAQFLQAAKDLKAGIDAWTKAINSKLPEASLISANQETTTSLNAADKIIAAFT